MVVVLVVLLVIIFFPLIMSVLGTALAWTTFGIVSNIGAIVGGIIIAIIAVVFGGRIKDAFMRMLDKHRKWHLYYHKTYPSLSRKTTPLPKSSNKISKSYVNSLEEEIGEYKTCKNNINDLYERLNSLYDAYGGLYSKKIMGIAVIVLGVMIFIISIAFVSKSAEEGSTSNAQILFTFASLIFPLFIGGLLIYSSSSTKPDIENSIKNGIGDFNNLTQEISCYYFSTSTKNKKLYNESLTKITDKVVYDNDGCSPKIKTNYDLVVAQLDECIAVDNKLIELVKPEFKLEYEESRQNAIYQDAISNIKDCKTVKGYEDAILKLKNIPDYKDSNEQIENFQKRINEIKTSEIDGEKKTKKKIHLSVIIGSTAIILIVASLIVYTVAIKPGDDYKAALTAYDNGKYAESYNALKNMNYKDSSKTAEEILAKHPSVGIKVGDSLTLGDYHGAIDWIVLDVKEGKALVISKLILDVRAFDDSTDYPEGYRNWEKCTLRQWLNNEFINEAFDSKVKRLIQTVSITNEYTGDKSGTLNTTKDRVFLLSVNEVDKYFKTTSSSTTFTEYALNKGLEDFEDYKYYQTTNWLLRTSGDDNGNPRVLVHADEYSFDVDGYRSSKKVLDTLLALACMTVEGGNEHNRTYLDVTRPIRPAMWINIDLYDGAINSSGS